MVDAAADDPDARRLVGCGTTWLDQRIVIADPESLTRCPPDRVGEIWLAGPNVAGGYWRRREETERTFAARLADTGEGPFLRTGDLGFLRSGELFVAGRLKDLIILRGVNHYPQDIEQSAEESHPAVLMGAAFALAHDHQVVVRLPLRPQHLRACEHLVAVGLEIRQRRVRPRARLVVERFPSRCGSPPTTCERAARSGQGRHPRRRLPPPP